MAHDRTFSATVDVVDADGGCRVGDRGFDRDRGDGGQVVVPLAGYRAGHGMRRRLDFQPTRLGADRKMGWQRKVIVLALRALSCAVAVLSFAWVVAWWT